MTAKSKVRFFDLPARSLVDGAACRNGGATVMLYTTGRPNMTDASERDAVTCRHRQKDDRDEPADPH